MQIQDRPGNHSPEYDWCSNGRGCFNEKGTVDKVNHIFLPSGNPFPKLKITKVNGLLRFIFLLIN